MPSNLERELLRAAAAGKVPQAQLQELLGMPGADQHALLMEVYNRAHQEGMPGTAQQAAKLAKQLAVDEAQAAEEAPRRRKYTSRSAPLLEQARSKPMGQLATELGLPVKRTAQLLAAAHRTKTKAKQATAPPALHPISEYYLRRAKLQAEDLTPGPTGPQPTEGTQ